MTTPNNPGSSPPGGPVYDSWTGTETRNAIDVLADGVPDTTIRPRRPEIPLEYPRPKLPKKKRKKKPPEQPPQSDKK
jgi:hypothetical protein